MRALVIFGLMALASHGDLAEIDRDRSGPQVATRVASLKITVLSTMLADRGIGEWGYAALVEVDGRKILFDTGARPETVMRNAEELGVDLSDVADVVVSHNHPDHTGGLLTLRRELMRQNPAALGRVYVAEGTFWTRLDAQGRQIDVLLTRQEYEATGGVVIEHDGPVQLAPGVWLTGPVPRVHQERNWGVTGRVVSPQGAIEDNVPEDSSMVINTAEGLVVLSGCGHAGVVNTVQYARTIVGEAPIHALIGGFHLFAASDEVLAWTGSQLRSFGVQHFLGGHCTGIEATYRLRDLLGLNRRTAVVSSVGSSFTLGNGIDPLRLAS